MESFLAKFAYWFLTECLNSWVFRAVIMGLAMISVSTVSYSLLEVYRSFRPSPYLDKLCNDTFILWAILIEAFVAFVGLLYILGVRLLIV